MITANEAKIAVSKFIDSKYSVSSILNAISERIRDTALLGRSQTSFSLPSQAESALYSNLIESLKNLGYGARISSNILYVSWE